MKDKVIIFLLTLNVITSCRKAIEEAQANNAYQYVTLYGYNCITNYVSIWCN